MTTLVLAVVVFKILIPVINIVVNINLISFSVEIKVIL